MNTHPFYFPHPMFPLQPISSVWAKNSVLQKENSIITRLQLFSRISAVSYCMRLWCLQLHSIFQRFFRGMTAPLWGAGTITLFSQSLFSHNPVPRQVSQSQLKTLRTSFQKRIFAFCAPYTVQPSTALHLMRAPIPEKLSHETIKVRIRVAKNLAEINLNDHLKATKRKRG